MSPAAIGWNVVKLRGWPSASNRAPMAASTASGQPRPLDELTVTTAPSGTRAAASAAASTRTRAISGLSQHFVERHPAPLARRALQGHGQRQRAHAVLAGGGRLVLAPDRGVEAAQRALVEVLVLDRQRLGTGLGAEHHLPDLALAHDVPGHQRALAAVDLEAVTGEADRERLVELGQEAGAEADHRHRAVLEPALGKARALLESHHLDRLVIEHEAERVRVVDRDVEHDAAARLGPVDAPALEVRRQVDGVKDARRQRPPD